MTAKPGLKQPFVESLVYLPNDVRSFPEQMRESLENDSVLGCNYLYKGRIAAARAEDWIYASEFHKALGRWWRDNAKELVEYIGARHFPKEASAYDIIALGPGNGYKELELCLPITRVSEDTTCYLYDFSWPVLTSAIRRFWNHPATDTAQLEVRAIVSDFSKLKMTVASAIPPDLNRFRVFTLLGATLGPNRPLLANTLDCLVTEKDLLVLDFCADMEPETDSKELMAHLFAPLERLGLVYDDSRMGWETVADDRVVVTQSWRAVYSLNEEERDQLKVDRVRIDGPYCFDRIALVTYLEELGFEILFAEFELKAFGVLVLRKRRKPN